MKNSILYYVISLLFIFSFSANAQIGNSTGASSLNRSDNQEILNEFFKGIKQNTDVSGNIAGNPYMENKFSAAQLIFPKGKKISADVRYNVVKEEMQVLFDEENYKVLHKGITVLINGHIFKMLSYKAENKTVDLLGYFEFLTPETDKKATLLRKYKKSVRRGKAAAAMQQATSPRYVDKEYYYIKFGNSQPVLVDRKTKKFMKLFSEDQKKDISFFMKINNLKSRDEDDLQKIINYYNTNIY